MNLTTATRIGLNTLGFLGLTVTLYLGKSVFIPLVISAMLAVMLWPAALWLNSRGKIPWPLACFTVIGGLIIVNLGFFLGIAAAVPRILQDMPNPNNPAQQMESTRRSAPSRTSSRPAPPTKSSPRT